MPDNTTTVFGICGAESLPVLRGVLEANAPAGCEVVLVSDLTSLRIRLEKARSRARLVSYLNNEIIPADMLPLFELGAFNFHPGSPEYPGTAPEAWACYDQAATFGATLHEMTAKVDEGPIVDVALFPVPPRSHRLAYAEVAHRMTHALLCKAARQLTAPAAIAPAADIAWTGKRRTAQDFQAMVQLKPDISKEELYKRIFCFGPPEVAGFSLNLHGVRFVMMTSTGVKGHFDPILHDTVTGWALHMAWPSRRLEITILVDGNAAFAVMANQHRADVLEAGHGDGYSGFSWEIPAAYRDGLPHSIAVSVAGAPLMGGPRLYAHTPGQPGDADT